MHKVKVCNWQCDQMWQNFALWQKVLSLWPFLEGSFSTWEIFEPIWANYYAIEQMYIAVKGQILKNNISIWSHW